MERFKNRPAWTRSVIGCVAAITILSAPLTVAAAADTQTTFIANYERNAQTEAQLLQKAEAGAVSNATSSALRDTVNQLNQQIASLYTVEQAVANSAQNDTTVTSISANVQTLQNQRQQIQTNLQTVQAQIVADRKKKAAAAVRSDTAQSRQLQQQLRAVTTKLSHIADAPKNLQASLGAGLKQLQQSIASLQRAVATYTRLWIAVQTPETP